MLPGCSTRVKLLKKCSSALLNQIAGCLVRKCTPTLYGPKEQTSIIVSRVVRAQLKMEKNWLNGSANHIYFCSNDTKERFLLQRNVKPSDIVDFLPDGGGLWKLKVRCSNLTRNAMKSKTIITESAM